MAAKAPSLSRRDQAVIARELIAQRYALARTAVRSAAVVAGIYFGREIVIDIAGKETALALKLSLLGDIKFSLAIGVAGLASLWATVERYLRHRKVEKLQGRIRELETAIDPNRSSSGLTPKGKTNPKDKTQ